MNDFESEDGKNNKTALWLLLQELEADALEPEKRTELMALLDHSPEAQTAYLEYFEMASMLNAEAAVLAERNRLPIVAPFRHPFQVIRRLVWAAAALLAIAAFVASLIIMKRPESNFLTAVHAAGTEWTVDGSLQSPGSKQITVSAGSTVGVQSGTVKLRLKSGATIVMQGPSRVSFPELEKPVLSDGWLWIDSEESGEKLEVGTPKLLIRDIGTRFGVRVSEKGPAEVHLINGKVEVFAKSTKKMITTLEIKEQGFAIPVMGPPAALALARDPFPTLADLMAAPENYATVVRSQNPAGYWRMGEETSGNLANEVPEGSIGLRQTQVELGESGLGQENGFQGFGRSNPSARLPAEPNGVPLSLGGAPIHAGDLFRDDFDTPHDYAGGVAGTIWHGVVNAENSVSLDAATTTEGQLRIEAGDSKGWEAGKNNAPFLYMNVSGDFDARVQVSSQTSGQYSIGALMARLGDPSANGDPGEDYMTLTSNGFGEYGIQARTLKDGAQNDSGEGFRGGFPRQLRLTRTGNTFNAFEGKDGTNWKPVSWGGLRGLAIGADLVRNDLDGLPLQLGLWQGSFTTSGHSADFDNFRIRLASEPASPPATRPGGMLTGVARKEGAVSFWIRREPGDKRREIIWAAGEHLADDSIQVRLDDDGRVGFFMEDGRYDVFITSQNDLADGNWHHFAASWSTSAVDLYLDGKHVARDSESRLMQEVSLSEVRAGGAAMEPSASSFNGWIDEIALWDRFLTSAEVVHQFRSARGK